MTVRKVLMRIVLIAALGVILMRYLQSGHPDSGLNVEELIRKYGYPLERHQVKTDDGYTLTLHRIPHGRNKGNQNSIPVLLMHGFMQSATDFVASGPGKALSLLLADRGYDVWLGNARGTTWSRKHEIFKPNEKNFWNFSLHEIGVYDLRSYMDYILEQTKEDSLHYIGYSQGTTIFFILVSEKPEYAKKVKLMSALAPAIFLEDPQGYFLPFLVNVRKLIEFLMNLLGLHNYLTENSIISYYLKMICDENSPFVNVCLHHIFSIQGYSHEQLNRTMLSMMFSNTPAGVSARQLFHILQLMETGEFHQLDLGTRDNLLKYGQEKPTKYDLSRVTTPVALYYSENDWPVNHKNIIKVQATLPNVVKSYLVPDPKFNHNDFVHAKDAVELLYNVVIEEISKY